MAVSIKPASIQDAPDMVKAGTAAFANDLMNKALFDPEQATLEQNEEMIEWRIERTRARMRGDGAVYFKAVDDSTGTLVGCIGMFRPFHGQSGPDADHALQATMPKPSFLVGKGDEMKARQEELNKKWVGDRKDVWYVMTMYVHPDSQGQGIAGRLLQQGLNEAGKVRQDVYLEATEEGLGLYLSRGFEVLEEIKLLDGRYTCRAMMWRHQGDGVNGTK